MQIDHPSNRLLIVASVKDVFRGACANLLQFALILVNLHPYFVDLVEASLASQLEDDISLLVHLLT